jgi:hypothetical protein
MVQRDINFREANMTLVLKLVSCNCPHCSVLKVGQAGTDPFREEDKHGEHRHTDRVTRSISKFTQMNRSLNQKGHSVRDIMIQ